MTAEFVPEGGVDATGERLALALCTLGFCDHAHRRLRAQAAIHCALSHATAHNEHPVALRAYLDTERRLREDTARLSLVDPNTVPAHAYQVLESGVREALRSQFRSSQIEQAGAIVQLREQPRGPLDIPTGEVAPPAVPEPPDPACEGILEQAFGMTFDASFSLVLEFAWTICGGRKDEVEDVVQETFLRLTRRAKSGLMNIRNPRAYLYQATRSAFLDQLEANGRWSNSLGAEMEVVDNTPGPEETAVRRADGQRYMRIIEQLEKIEHREVIRAIVVDGLSWTEASRQLKKSESTLRGRLDSAIRELRNMSHKPNRHSDFGGIA